MSETSGVVFLDKPEGLTSRQAVDKVRALFADGGRMPKAGHAGTLDPMATGMLPILLGEGTRLAFLGLDADKTYRFAVDFSVRTDTLDRDGRVLARYEEASRLSRSAVEAAAARFVGTIRQVPPAFSAIKRAGRAAYRDARQGREVSLPAREVQIRLLELLDWQPPVAEFRCVCSKGTYVRALARDLGEALGAGGTVVTLRRLSTGGWPETMMHPLEAIAADPWKYLVPLSVWVAPLPRLTLAKETARRFAHGQRLRVPHPPAETVAVFGGETLLGLGRVDARGVLHPKCVLASARARIFA